MNAVESGELREFVRLRDATTRTRRKLNLRRRRLEVFGFAWPGGGSTSFRWPIHVRSAAIRAAHNEAVSLSRWIVNVLADKFEIDPAGLRDELTREAKEQGLSMNAWVLAAVCSTLGFGFADGHASEQRRTVNDGRRDRR